MTEKYVVNHHLPFTYRKAIAQFRCGVAPLQIELGRYDHGIYVPECRRICRLCDDGVEDEFHTLFHCTYHVDLQTQLITGGTTCQLFSMFRKGKVNSHAIHFWKAEFV